MECIDSETTPCVGEVFPRLSVTGATRTPRCEGHYEAYRQRTQPKIDAINRRYPRQAPADFDPTYAGECWNEDY